MAYLLSDIDIFALPWPRRVRIVVWPVAYVAVFLITMGVDLNITLSLRHMLRCARQIVFTDPEHQVFLNSITADDLTVEMSGLPITPLVVLGISITCVVSQLSWLNTILL